MEGNNIATRTISTIFDDQFVDIWPLIYEEFDDIKGVIIIRKSKDNNKEKGQNDKQRFAKHTHKTKDRVTRTQLKTGVERRCP